MSLDLIDRLAGELAPAPRGAVTRRLALGTGAGALASAAVLFANIGLRPDLAQAAGEAMFWVKLGYVAALALVAAALVERLARPGRLTGHLGAWLALPCAAVVVVAALQWMQAPAAERPALTMGHSAALCPWLILALSLPPLAGLVWAVRGLGPTRLRAAGAAVGLAAGGVGATIYCLHCDEGGAPFLAIWYTLALAGAAAAGALIGPRALRW